VRVAQVKLDGVVAGVRVGLHASESSVLEAIVLAPRTSARVGCGHVDHFAPAPGSMLPNFM
jgi:hypothetical protein